MFFTKKIKNKLIKALGGYTSEEMIEIVINATNTRIDELRRNGWLSSASDCVSRAVADNQN